MLWWREELRDISIRFYYLIRTYTLRLAEFYQTKGIIDSVDDIWYLKIKDIFEYMDNTKTTEELKSIIKRNKTYYSSFRNFKSENEIGSAFSHPSSQEINGTNRIIGTGSQWYCFRYTE